MARAKSVRGAQGSDERLVKAELLAAGVIRIVKLIKIVATLPEGRMREGLKAEVDRQIEVLRAETA